MRLALPIATLCLSILLMGCARFPEVYASTSLEAQQAETPVLEDVDDVLAPTSADLLDETTQAQMEARGADLQARAQSATGPVIAPEDASDLAKRASTLRQEAARVAQDG